MKPLLAAWRFLTIVPIPGNWGMAEEDLARSVVWFPVIGLMLGVVAAGLAYGLTSVAPPLVVAAAMIVILLSFSGGLHLDGLADTADGFFSSRPRERILEMPIPDFRTLSEGVDDKLNGILHRALARGRAARYPDAEEMLDDLEHYIYDQGYGPTNETLGKFIRELFGQRPPARSLPATDTPIFAARIARGR